MLQRQLAFIQQRPAAAAIESSSSAANGTPSYEAAQPTALSSSRGEEHQQPPELPFLRHRVQQMSVENRQLRRLCVQLRLVAAKLQAGSSAPEADASTPPSSTRQQQTQQTTPLSGGVPLFDTPWQPLPTSPPPAAPPPTRAEEALRRELSEAASELGQLRQENGRLMEMSNALRAERDKLRAAGAGQTATAAATSGGPPIGNGGSDGNSPALRMGGTAASRPPWPPQQSSPATGPVVVPSPPPPSAAPSLMVPPPSSLPYTVMTAFPSGGGSGRDEGHGGVSGAAGPTTWQQQQKEQQLPSNVIFAQEEAEAARALRGSGSSRAVQGFFTDASLRHHSAATTGMGRRDASDAAAAEVAVSRAQHRSRSPMERALAGTAGSTSPGSSPVRPRAATPAGLQGGAVKAAESGGEGPQASIVSPGVRPPSSVPGSASLRETASQRARLQALQRRGEDEMAKPKVRNYNNREE